MNSTEAADLKIRLVAITTSLVVGAALMALKFYAYWLTDSAAILSDALESIINVVASAFALGASFLPPGGRMSVIPMAMARLNSYRPGSKAP